MTGLSWRFEWEDAAAGFKRVLIRRRGLDWLTVGSIDVSDDEWEHFQRTVLAASVDVRRRVQRQAGQESPPENMTDEEWIEYLRREEPG